MAGLVGYIGSGAIAPTLRRVRAMDEALAHRGPDDRGLLVWDDRSGTRYQAWGSGRMEDLEPPAEPGGGQAHACVILAHRRLATHDRSPAAHQPMCTPDGRYWISFDGAVYNHRELRAELEASGKVFRTSGDTEVLLLGWAAWGESVVQRLVGMFAFLIFDTRERSLSVCRDPLGIKPLYYRRDDDGIVWASEPAALLHGVAARSSPGPLLDYLVDGITDHRPETFFEGVRSFPAAALATVRVAATSVSPRAYWNLPPSSGRREIDFRDAVRETRDRFLRSVELHLKSDVPVGALLSGGVDSSAVVMAMREVGGDQLDIHTFSYLPGEGAVNEGPWIEAVHRSARTHHHTSTVEQSRWERDAAEVARAQGEPFGSLAVFVHHALLREARENGVRVILDGLGADAMLGGSRWAWSYRVLELLRQWHGVGTLRFLNQLRVLRSPPDPGPLQVLRRALGIVVPRRSRPPTWMSAEWFAAHSMEARRLSRPPSTWAAREHLTITQYGLPALLRIEDRNAMSSSVEGRLPFVSGDFVEFVLSLPAEYLVARDGTSKHVFREAMRGMVPDAVLERREKVGFSVPLGRFAQGSDRFAKLVADAGGRPPLDPSWTRRVARRLEHGQSLDRQDLPPAWRIAGFEEWARALQVEDLEGLTPLSLR